MKFGLEHNKLPEQHTPHDDKTPEGLAFVKVLLQPLKKLYEKFMSERAATLYKLQHASQVIYLEKVLNEQFNNGLPAYTNGVPTGIYIGKPLSNLKKPVLRKKIEQRKGLVLWKKADPTFNPATHEKIVLRKKAEYFTNIGFIVYVPIGCFDITVELQKLIKLKGWVKYYDDIANFIVVNY